MANLSLYSKCAVYLNGKLLAEEGKVSIKRTTAAQVIKTVAKGFAGMSPGAAMMEISVTNAVPSADFEVNPGPFEQQLQVVELTFFAASRTLTTKAFITSDSFSHAVDTPSELSFECVAQWTDWN